MDLDSTDQKIINELIDSCKMPLRTLADKIGVSFVTVMNRMKKLEKNGVINKYSARVNYDKLGYDTHVVIEIRIAKGKLIELESKIASSPNVYAVYDTTGDFDAIVLARFKNTRAMDNFLKAIQTYDFVERTNTKLILNTIKESQVRV
jgi:DNA-binding Lrp family transcriptional regulator